MHFAHLVTGEVNRATEVTLVASGKSINVARVLHTLGKKVLATGFLGGDTGRYMRCELQREGIAEAFVEVASPTRTCVTLLDRATGVTTELVEEAGPVAPEHWEALLALIRQQLRQAKALVLSGNLSPSSPVDFYARCAQAAAQAEVPVIIDARGKPLQLALPFRPALVKPNREELGQTLGVPITDEVSLRAASEQLLAAGCQAVLVTHGAAGAALAQGGSLWHVRSPQVQAVNPIGSGDSVAAGFTAALVEGKPLLEAVRLGIACGAANALTPTPGVVRPEDVACLLQQVIAEPM